MKEKANKQGLRAWMWSALAVLVAILVVNQAQIISANSMMGPDQGMAQDRISVSSDLSGVDVSSVQSTAQGMAAVMALEGRNQQEVLRELLPGGTPEYQQAMGVSFDDPTGSLTTLARSYPALKADIKQNDPETYQRWIDLASSPKGVSCEYCCAIGAYAITKDGRDMCGCQHHPALQTVTLWLMQNTEMNDAEVLREVYRWKALFFPRDMTSLGVQIAGGDTSVLEDLPGMVGGC